MRAPIFTKVGATLTAAAVLVGLAIASPTVTGVFSSDDAPTSNPTTIASSTRLTPAQAVDFWAERTADRPNDFISRTHLAASQLRYARASGDDLAYAAAASNAEAALEIKQDYEPAVTALGASQLASHDFVGAAATAQIALELDPNSVSALSLLGDASFDAGDVDQARSAYRELATLDQSAPVLSRKARLAAFEEGPDRGLELAQAALAEALRSDLTIEDLNFYRIQLASYHFAVGEIEPAHRAVRDVLTVAPDHPVALFWQGRLLAADGDLDAALGSFEAGLAGQRHPEFVAEYADVHLALGNVDVAASLLEEAVLGASGGALDAPGAGSGPENRHLVHILSDHQIDTHRAVALAEAELDHRRDAAGYDALAWALFANREFDAAAAASLQARAAGVPTAEMLYHAAAIAHENGDNVTSRVLLEQALEINAHFDVLKVRDALRLLELLE